jgi:hypothetical protein
VSVIFKHEAKLWDCPTQNGRGLGECPTLGKTVQLSVNLELRVQQFASAVCQLAVAGFLMSHIAFRISESSDKVEK